MLLTNMPKNNEARKNKVFEIIKNNFERLFNRTIDDHVIFEFQKNQLRLYDKCNSFELILH
jgi:hypothetical protein